MNVVRFAFQTMVGIGTLLAVLGLVYLYLRIRRGRLPQARWFYWAVVLAGPLSVVALIAGWITTEVGRQPWIVYDVMKVDQAVTGAHVIRVGYAALCVVYLGLAGAVFWLLRRFSQVPLETGEAGETGKSGETEDRQDWKTGKRQSQRGAGRSPCWLTCPWCSS